MFQFKRQLCYVLNEHLVILLQVGYIVMMDPSTGARSNLLRMTGAGVVGVYHPLIDEKLVRILHGYDFNLDALAL